MSLNDSTTVGPEGGDTVPAGDEPVVGGEKPRGSSVAAIGYASLFALGFLAAVPLCLWALNRALREDAAISLAVVLIAAAAALIVVVAMLSVAFNRMRISNNEHAMGLPQGSIRAIIALLLIVLFFISAIYLYSSIAQGPPVGPTRILNGITAAQLATLPATEIDSVQARGSGASTVYDVVLAGRRPDNSRSDDVAAQLITIVATLVTAVAAFYFGANSVNTAASTAALRTTDAVQAATKRMESETAASVAATEKAAAEAKAAKAMANFEAAAADAEAAAATAKEKPAAKVATETAAAEAAEEQGTDEGVPHEQPEAEDQGTQEPNTAPEGGQQPTDDEELAELESEDLTDPEVEDIRRHEDEVDDDTEVS